ncbi:pro-sigmaK processing inhibitor BofA family protein [Peptococcaceae bacterium]|nr:pro-sigmaK processing inhibitor BofA family protein [Peptococcaceae bacterium]
MEWTTITIVLVGLAGLYLIGVFIIKPLKLIFKLVVWVIIGILLLIVVNLMLSYFGIYIPLNPLTIFTAGILQVPGVILLVLMNYVLL